MIEHFSNFSPHEDHIGGVHRLLDEPRERPRTRHGRDHKGPITRGRPAPRPPQATFSTNSFALQLPLYLSFFIMDETRTHLEPSQAEPPPSQKEQAPKTAQSRKRHIDSDSDDEPTAKRTRLTRKNLALFDTMGKKKAADSTDESGSTKTTSTTTSGFAGKARKNRIHHPLHSKPPTDLEIEDTRK